MFFSSPVSLICMKGKWEERKKNRRRRIIVFDKKFLFSLLLLDLFLYISLAQRGVNNRYTKLEKARHRVEIRNRIRNFQIQIIFQSYFLVHKTSIKIRQRFCRNRIMTFSSKQKINGKRQRRRFETGDEEGGSNKIFKRNVFSLVPREILNIKKMCSMSLHFTIAFIFDLEKKL